MMTTNTTSLTVTRLSALLLAIGLSCAVVVQAEQNEQVPSSDYRPLDGEQFFLLADSSYAANEQALVRLEAPGRDYRRYSMEAYGGADVRLYRIDEPLAFLQRQKNLHRIKIEGNYRGEGVANALGYLWDHWYRQSRRAMQRVFNAQTRRTVTEQMPELKMGEAIAAPTRFSHETQFEPIAGLPLVDRFRYPLWEAQPIAPPVDVNLAGSSSEFIEPKPGNVYIPLGKRAPGLYLVEAIIGKYRATTVVFVSNTVAITKIAGDELLVWTARKQEGTPVAQAEVLWSDGVGVLTRGKTDAQGLLRLSHSSPERSYVLGQDSEGGVFVSENFYYDSEIYDTKLYGFTDRPLYRPGDWVAVKILGREFKSARESARAQDAPVDLQVLDANGTVLQQLRLDFTGERGADTRFQLPDNATAGGYELRFAYRGQLYSSAFRVAEYIKPHFEIVLDLDKDELHTNQPVLGELSLVYPDGKPVAAANVQLSLRAQQLSMVDNELQYLGQFPIELTSAELKTDAEGKARLKLPAADKPSRYLLTVFASDGAAYRVKASKEILIERGAAQYRVVADRRFSAAGESVKFSYALEGMGQQQPVRYEWVRLEDQSRGGDSLTTQDPAFSVAFDKPGTYNLSLLDANGMILGGTGHAVSGEGIKSTPGSIEIVFDKPQYQAGDTAQALITFPEPVGDALLTLERDQVEATALLSQSADWLQLKRLNDTQVEARIAVADAFAPNLTFSVLYTKGGEYSFQNAGIQVAMPSVDVAIATEREVYAPGDLVTVDLQTRLQDRGVPTRLTVSVVDEMIYALQPEIAPTIGEFFYHPRRNNVRTTASLAFIAYDMAVPGSPTPPSASNRSERGVKVLERPRREEVDTAAWEADLVTDAQGKAQLRFRMPDSLTRWRITARAVAADGLVGQRRAFVRSDKSLYLKWSGPTVFRAGDEPTLGLLAFQNGEAEAAVDAELITEWNGQPQTQKVSLSRGASWLPVPRLAMTDGVLKARLQQNGQTVDALEVTLRTDPLAWQALSSRELRPSAASTPLDLPSDAHDIQLQLATGSDALFRGALDDLLEYPWGCVEQTASRLLPLSIAYPLLREGEARVDERLRLSLQTARLRLVQMAGPEAHFAWWGGDTEGDAFLTAYAYYADLHASKALGLSLPSDHFQRVLDIYATQAEQLPLLQRVLILDFAQAMEMPVRSMLEGVMAQMTETSSGQKNAARKLGSVNDFSVDSASAEDDWNDPQSSLLLAGPDSALARDVAQWLALRLARDVGASVPGELQARSAAIQSRLQQSNLPFVRAALMHRGAADATRAADILATLAPQYATMDRAIVLSWLQSAASTATSAELPKPQGAWQAIAGSLSPRWAWQAEQAPATLDLSSAPDGWLAARVSFQSASPVENALPVTIQRRLWKLVPGNDAFAFAAVAVDAPELDSNALYLDEVVLRNDSDTAMRYGLLEVPLPPGADVERTTWGLQISGLAGDSNGALDGARHEMGQMSYAVPVDSLSGEIVLRHLLRFSQKGQFELPPARFHRMYQPAQQAFEVEPALQHIDVR